MMSKHSTAPEKLALVIADLDGTLLTSDKRLTPRTVQAVRALGNAGLSFAVTSGRPPLGTRMFIAQLALTIPMAAFNGGIYVAPRDLSPIQSYALDGDLVVQVLSRFKEYRLEPWLYDARRWLVHDAGGPHVAREQRNVQLPPVEIESFTDYTSGVLKVVGVSDDHQAVIDCERTLQNQLGSRVSAERSQPYYLDVTHWLANKGHVLEHLSRWLKVPAESIATIGDQDNDVLMFRRSGLAIAMGNAPTEVRAQANWTTATCNEDGFARAMERLIDERAHAHRPSVLS